MDIATLLSPRSVIADLRATAKKQTLQELAYRAAAASGLHERTIIDAVWEREKLGSTGLGGGIAIPHARIAGLKSLHGVFARLVTPIDFDAVDDRPVDLIFMLIAPEGAGADHLTALARVSRAMRDRTLVEKIRASSNADAIYALLTGFARPQAA
ncbi:MAG: PTS IIA-like nitrogen regulatory protein PtsN [Alphaproteobacteria bacterium]|nr:PTS IIA-like nitrogen regulatory protein PtsN [Alphaproteobacteria bacterium]